MVPDIPKRRRGRPTKAEAAESAIAEAAAQTLAAFDPRAVLAEIAANQGLPAMARVAACKTLLDDAGAGREIASRRSARAHRQQSYRVARQGEDQG
jgi:hypothetical protein